MNNTNVLTTTLNTAVASLNAARSGIQIIGQPILFAFGMIGCLLNIAIFLRRSMRTNSCAIYFHASSWANLFCLTWGLLVSLLGPYISNNNPLTYNAAYCKIRYYLLTAAQLASRACVVLACLDRFLLCSQSVRQRSFCRPKVAIIVASTTIAICAGLSIYVLVVYDAFPQTRQCNTNSAAGKILDTTVLFSFNFGTPALLMSTLSGLIIWRLHQNAKRMGAQRVQVRNRDVQLAGMLIGQVVLYITTALPFVSTMLYTTVTQYDPPSIKSSYRIAAENLALTATVIILCLHVDSTHLRRELYALIIPRKWMIHLQQRERQQQSISVTNRINPTFYTKQLMESALTSSAPVG